MFTKNYEAEKLFRKICPRVDVGRHCFLAGIVKTATCNAKNDDDVLECFEQQIATLETTDTHIHTTHTVFITLDPHR